MLVHLHHCDEMVTIFLYENDDDGGDTVVDDLDDIFWAPQERLGA